MFGEYPLEIITEEQKREYDNALFNFKENYVELGDCWIPRREYIRAFGNVRSVASVALMLQGPIHNKSRSRYRIVSLCENVTCCNPEHLQLVPKKDVLYELLYNEFVMSDTPAIELWDDFRHKLSVAEDQNIKQMQRLQNRISTTTDDAARRILVRQLTQLNTPYQSFHKVALTYLFKSTNDIFSNFMTYLKTKECLTWYRSLTISQQQYIKNFLEDSNAKANPEYFNAVITSIALTSLDDTMLTLLKGKGVISTYES